MDFSRIYSCWYKLQILYIPSACGHWLSNGQKVVSSLIESGALGGKRKLSRLSSVLNQ